VRTGALVFIGPRGQRAALAFNISGWSAQPATEADLGANAQFHVQGTAVDHLPPVEEDLCGPSRHPENICIVQNTLEATAIQGGYIHIRSSVVDPDLDAKESDHNKTVKVPQRRQLNFFFHAFKINPKNYILTKRKTSILQ